MGLPIKKTFVTWYPADEKPDDGTTILLNDHYSDDPVQPGYYDSQRECYRFSNGDEAMHVHRWCHIPHPDDQEVK